MSMRDLIDGDVEVDEEENDEEFDEEIGEPTSAKPQDQNGALDDDSSEEEDDDDEEAARAVFSLISNLRLRVITDTFLDSRRFHCR